TQSSSSRMSSGRSSAPSLRMSTSVPRSTRKGATSSLAAAISSACPRLAPLGDGVGKVEPPVASDAPLGAPQHPEGSHFLVGRGYLLGLPAQVVRVEAGPAPALRRVGADPRGAVTARA